MVDLSHLFEMRDTKYGILKLKTGEPVTDELTRIVYRFVEKLMDLAPASLASP